MNLSSALTVENVPAPDYFEGPEKLLEVWFEPSGRKMNSLRTVSRERWQAMLDDVNCKILSVVSNEHLDAFLLSESSFFVYDREIVLKTCGTTTLLKALPKLLEYAKECGLDRIGDFFYSRKNFGIPQNQQFPHFDFSTEIQYLDKVMAQSNTVGSAFILGKLNGDHWYLYTSESPKGPEVPDQTLEILMNELDPEIMKNFYCSDSQKAGSLHGKGVAERTGIANLIPGSQIDDYFFSPCGYSANGILDDSYWTIHVTPQTEFSYVSFETNQILTDYKELVDKVLQVFKPGRFIVSLFANRSAKCCTLPKLPSLYNKTAQIAYDFDSYELIYHNYSSSRLRK